MTVRCDTEDCLWNNKKTHLCEYPPDSGPHISNRRCMSYGPREIIVYEDP